MELFRLVCRNGSCWHTVCLSTEHLLKRKQDVLLPKTISHLQILVHYMFTSFCGQGVELFFHWGLRPQYDQVQTVRTGCDKSTRRSLKQEEYSGSVPFVVALIGCFLRKLLWPVPAKVQSESTEYFKVCSVYIELSLCLAGHFLLPGLSFRFFCFLTAPCEPCTTHAYTALSVNNTAQERIKGRLPHQGLLPHRNTGSYFRQPLVQSKIKGDYAARFHNQDLFGCFTQQPFPAVLMPVPKGD